MQVVVPLKDAVRLVKEFKLTTARIKPSGACSQDGPVDWDAPALLTVDREEAEAAGWSYDA